MGLSVRGYTRRGGRRTKRRMEGRVGGEVGQDLPADLGPRDGLEARGRSTRLLEEKFIIWELNQYGVCHRFLSVTALVNTTSRLL